MMIIIMDNVLNFYFFYKRILQFYFFFFFFLFWKSLKTNLRKSKNSRKFLFGDNLSQFSNMLDEYDSDISLLCLSNFLGTTRMKFKIFLRKNLFI